jgi:hypothetical protein
MPTREGEFMMRKCRECGHDVSEQAPLCPQCGVPLPARAKSVGWGFEYKSSARILGLPLLHISFKYRPDRLPDVARGVISIGQFGCGIINISQFGIGLISVSQFTVAGFAVAQFAAAYSLMAQFGLYIHYGHGQFTKSLVELSKAIGG